MSLHRHAALEIHKVIVDAGTVMLDGKAHEVRAGSVVCIPSNCEHGIRNDSDGPLHFVHVYETDSIDDIRYVWSSH